MSVDLYTEDVLKYQYYPATSNILNFKVKAAHDAHIILTTTPYDSIPCYEIFFGGWNNTKSVIRKNQQKPDVVEVSTFNLLSSYEYRSFWIRWNANLIQAGIQGNANPILIYQDTQSIPIQYFGVCTGWGAKGHWIIERTSSPYSVPSQPVVYPPPLMDFPSYRPPPYNPDYTNGYHFGCLGVGGRFHRQPLAPRWVPAANGTVPSNAVIGGKDVNGDTIYVARAVHEGALLPGKLVATHTSAYVPWGGREVPKIAYEVLCDCAPKWIQTSGSQIPPGALICGQSENGETLYAGRAFHNGSQTPGKVQVSHGVCYIPYGGEEISKQSYEILVL